MRQSIAAMGVVLIGVLLWSTGVPARDAMVDLLVNKGVITEADVAAAESQMMERPAVTAKAGDIMLGGYIQAEGQWLEEGDVDTALGIKRARPKIWGTLTDNFMFVLELEATADLLPRNVEVAWKHSDSLTVHAGQFKVPFSLENITSSSNLLTVERSAIAGVADEYDLGVLADGALWEGKIGYGVALVNGEGLNATEENKEKDVAARVTAMPWLGNEGALDNLVLGAAVQMGDQPLTVEGVDALGEIIEVPAGNFERLLWGGQAQWTYNGWTWQGEYINAEQDLPGGGSAEADGWYVLGGFDFHPTEGALIVQPVAKYEQIDEDGDEATWVTAGVNLYFTEQTKLQLNYIMKDEDPVEVDNDTFLALWQVKY